MSKNVGTERTFTLKAFIVFVRSIRNIRSIRQIHPIVLVRTILRLYVPSIKFNLQAIFDKNKNRLNGDFLSKVRSLKS